MTKNHIQQFPKKNHHPLASMFHSCGDFQLAHKNTWHKIKGFEESMIKRGFGDTRIQYKVLMAGGNLRATNFPPIYHLDHERNDSPHLLNSDELSEETSNSDKWGFSEEKFYNN